MPPGESRCPEARKTVRAPDGLYNQETPLSATADHIEAGRRLYHEEAKPMACKLCHGDKGDGMGPLAQGMMPMPRNFTCSETMKEIPDGQLFWVIKNGSPGTGMPAFGTLSDQEIWRLILYVRQFAK